MLTDNTQEEINNLLESFQSAIIPILGSNLFGIYLYGSLVGGDFDCEISDIDLLVVTQSDIDKNEFSKLDNMHLELTKIFPNWDDRIEVAYIAINALKTLKTQRSQIAVISPGEPFNIKDAGTDWLINWYLIREKSITFLGPDPKTFIEAISKQEYFYAVKSQMKEWYDWIVHTKNSRPFQSYAVLTMCRGLYVLQNGEQVSKKQAAIWAQKSYPQWASIIEKAITWRMDYKNKEVDPTLTYNEVEKSVLEMIELSQQM